MSLLGRLRGRLQAARFRPLGKDMAIVGGVCFTAFASCTLVAHNLITYGASEGPSMYPTIPSGLSYNISSRRHKHGKNIQVGDLIVFKSPLFAEQESCKRVIGLPGDYVLRDPALSPTVGGARIPGPHEEATDVAREEPVMVQVPEGHVWVAGDNLSYSRDSRFHGPVPMALIQGKTLYSGTSWFTWTSFRRSQLQPAIVAGEASAESAPKVTQPG